MTERKWTPGPWVVHHVPHDAIQNGTSPDGGAIYGEDYYGIVSSNSDIICNNTHYYPVGLEPRNANLIAAAPDLYEALAFILTCDHDQIKHEAADMARAALAKARGE